MSAVSIDDKDGCIDVGNEQRRETVMRILVVGFGAAENLVSNL
jgi:hypothetical protein